MNVVDLPRVRRARAKLDRLVAAYPELLGEGARLAALVDTAELHELHEADLAAVPPANDNATCVDT